MAIKKIIAMISLLSVYLVAPVLASPVSSSAIKDCAVVARSWQMEETTLVWPTHDFTFDANITTTTDSGRVPDSSAITCTDNGVSGWVVNNCGFTIYAHTSRGNNTCLNQGGIDAPSNPVGTITVNPGTTYQAGIRAVVGGRGGVSVKVGTNPIMDPNNVYQLEYAQYPNGDGNMAVWYDLSNVEGDPFLGYKRYMQVTTSSTACPKVYMGPGNPWGDWDDKNKNTQHSCQTVGDVYLYLC